MELFLPNMVRAEIKGTVYRESGVFGLMHWKPHKRILLEMLYFVILLFLGGVCICVYSLETLQLFQKDRKLILNIENRYLLSVLLCYRTFFLAVSIILKYRDIL